MILFWVCVSTPFILAIGIPIGTYAIGYWASMRAEFGYCDDDKSAELFEAAEQELQLDEVETMGFTPDSVVYIEYDENLIFYYVVWRHGEDETYLWWIKMVSDSDIKSLEVMMISELSRDPNISLSTGTQKKIHEICLIPGDYLQTFSSADFTELWYRHRESEAYLIEQFNITDTPKHAQAIDVIKRSFRESGSYVLRHPWVILAQPYRYWIAKHYLHNKSIIKYK